MNERDELDDLELSQDPDETQEAPQGDDFLAGWEDQGGDETPDGAEDPAEEAVLPPAEPEEQAPQETPAAALAPDELRMRSDILEFARSFPEAAADPAAIPPEIWAAVGRGRSLTAAYAQWAVGREREKTTAAQRRSQTLERSRRNALRSTGSMRTAGDGSRRNDPFLEGWDD